MRLSIHRGVALLTLLLAGSVHAQTAISWNFSGTDFTSSTSWTGNAVPANSTTTNTASFSTAGVAGTYNAILNSDRSIAGLILATGGNAGVNFSGNGTLTLGAAGLNNQRTVSATNNTLTVSSALALGANSTFTSAGGNTLVTGPLSLGGFTLTVNGTGAQQLTGNISGTGALAKSGTGALTLSGNNTYSGGTSLTNGTLTLGSDTALGTGTLTLGGGTLSFAGRNLTNAVTITANTTLAGSGSAGTNSTLSGAITLAANTTLTGSTTGPLVFNGALGESGGNRSVTFSGGPFVLNAASTYTGNTTIAATTVALGAAGTLSAANLALNNGGVLAAQGTFNRALGTGTGQVQFTGTGGGFAAYGGALTVNVGNGSTWGTTASFLPATGNLILGSALADNVVTWTGNFSLGAATRNITVVDNTNSTADRAVISGVISGTGGLNLNGSGRLELSGNNTYSGGTTLGANTTIRASHANAFGTGNVTFANTTLELAGDTATTFGRNLTSAASSTTLALVSDRATAGAGVTHTLGSLTLNNTIVNVTAGTNVTSGTAGVAFGTATLNGTANRFDAATNTAVSLAGITGNTFSVEFRGNGSITTGAIAPSASASVTKNGNGTLTFTGNNTFGGDVVINGGTVTVDSGANLSANTSWLVLTGNSTLNLNNAATSLPNLSGSAGTTINLGTGHTLTINGIGSVYQGDIAGAGAVVKSGTGTIGFSGNNTYTGGTTISGGTLVLNSGATLGSGNVTLAGGTLSGGTQNSTLTNAISVTGNSSLIVASTTATLSLNGTTTLAANATLTGSSNGAVAFNGAIGESGGARNLTLAGNANGLFFLNAANTYTGTTNVTNGAYLALGANGTISAANLAIQSGSGLGGTGNITRAIGTGAGQMQFTSSTGATHGFFARGGPFTVGWSGTPVWGTTAGFFVSGYTLLLNPSSFPNVSADNVVTLTGNFSLGASNQFIQVDDNTATTADKAVISGAISGTGGIIKQGSGLLEFSGNNTYTGNTTLSAGTLATIGNGTLGSGNLALSGGVYGASGNFTRALGTGAGQVQFSSLGGLAAYGGNLTITGFTGTPVWGNTTGFVPGSGASLQLNSALATGVLYWTNDFSLGTNATRSINVIDNPDSTTDRVIISGNISGGSAGFGLNLGGSGTLTLSGNNTYLGNTTISGGTFIPGSNQAFSSGTLRIQGGGLAGDTVERTIANPVSIEGSFRFTGDTRLTFSGNVSNLNSSSYTVTNNATAPLTFAGAFTINQLISFAGSGTTEITGNVSGSQQIVKSGTGTLRLAGANNSSFTGQLSGAGGTLRAEGNGSALGTGALDLSGGVMLSLAGNSDLTFTRNITLSTSGNGTVEIDRLTPGAAVAHTLGTLSMGAQTLTITPGANITSGTAGVSFGATSLISTATFAPAAGTRLTLASLAGQAGASRSAVFTGAGDTVITGNIAQAAGNLTKSGSGTLTLTGTNNSTGATTLSAGTLEFSANSLAAGALTIDGGTLRWAAGNTADVSARFAALGASGATFDTNGNAVTFASALSGAGAFTKAGTGTLTLSAANTYTGATTIAAGTLRLGADGALSNSTAVTVSSGATFDVNGKTDTIASLAGAGSLALGTGALTVGPDNSSTTFSGAISGSGSLIKSGSGTLTLTGTNSHTGNLTVSGGTLEFNAASLTSGPITVDGGTLRWLSNSYNVSPQLAPIGAGGATFDTNGNSILFSSALSGSGSITKSGLGTLTLGSGNSYSGATTISAGTLRLSSNGANGFIPDASAVTVAAGATFDLNNRTETIGSLAGAGNVTLGAGALTVGGDDSSTTFSGGLSGSGSFTKSGAGTLTLATITTHTGATTVSAGTLRLGNAGALSDTTAVSVVFGATLDLAGNSDTIGSLAGAGNVTLGGATLTVGSDNSSTTFSGILSGAGSVDKTGTGVWRLQGENTYTGPTVISAGTLRLGANEVINNSSRVTVAAGATLDVNGQTETVGTFGGAGNVTLGNGALTTVGTSNSTSTFDGIISGSGSFTKAGAGTLSFTGANSYTGNTTVSGGTLQLGADHALANSTTVAVASGATFDLNGRTDTIAAVQGNGTVSLGGGALTLAGNLDRSFGGTFTGAGSVAKTGSGTLTLSGANDLTGTVAIQAGTLQLDGSLASANVALGSGATLRGAGSIGNLDLAGTYAPGNSPALVSLGNLTLTSTGLFQMEIAGLTRGTGYDALNVSGTFNAGGTLAVTFIDGFAPVSPVSFNILDFNLLTGTFSTINLPTLTGPLAWDTSALYSDGTLSIIAAPIPEPTTTAALIGVAGLGLVLWRRRRK